MNSKNPIFFKSPFPPRKVRNKFITYKNYSAGLHYLLDLMYPDYSKLVNKLKKNVHPKKQENLQRIRSLLLNSWNSELLLNFPGLLKNDSLKFSNHWAPVQSYYSIYLALRALILAKGISSAKEGHNKTLRVTVYNFIQGEKIFPLPWKVLYSNRGFQNLPQNISPSTINSLENPYHFINDEKKLWDSFCLFLRTTYDRMIENKCQRWKDNNPINGRRRKRLPPGQRKKIANGSRPSSIFDYFYRLRIRSNYKDADIFLLGSLSHENEYYFNAICYITDKTLFLIEYYIARYIGKKQMKQIIDRYESADRLKINKNLRYNSIKRFKYYN